jgi:hypothetical protein
MTKRVILCVTILVLLLSGCTFRSPVPQDLTHEQTWTSDHPYYGVGMKFQLATSSLFSEDNPVFRITSEEELALLLAIKFDQGENTIEYLSENPIDTQRVISYLTGLFVHDFEYFESTYEYSDKGKLKLVSNYVELKSDRMDVVYVEKEIDAWTAEIKKQDLIPLNEAKALHDLIITEVRYDESASESEDREIDAFSAKGVFEDGLAVCNGYSQAYMGLLKEMGIPAIMISSDVDDHAWNMVYIENEWQYVDTTWDDFDYLVEKPMYDYFLKDENEFVDHIFDEPGYITLSEEEYLDFAQYVFPQTYSLSPK